MTGWLAVFAAGLFEIAWAFGLKYSDGLTRFWPTLATALAILASFALMAFALRSLPFGKLRSDSGELNDLCGFDVAHDCTAFPAGALIKASIAAAMVARSW